MKERENLVNLGVDGRMIMKSVLEDEVLRWTFVNTIMNLFSNKAWNF